MVTHSTAGLEDFDEVLVLERGRIVERGRHAELIARPGGHYAELAEREEPRAWRSCRAPASEFAGFRPTRPG